MQIGLDGLGAHEGLAQPDQALVGVQAHPEDVGKLAEADGFELSDLHAMSGKPAARADGSAAAGACDLVGMTLCYLPPRAFFSASSTMFTASAPMVGTFLS